MGQLKSHRAEGIGDPWHSCPEVAGGPTDPPQPCISREELPGLQKPALSGTVKGAAQLRGLASPLGHWRWWVFLWWGGRLPPPTLSQNLASSPCRMALPHVQKQICHDVTDSSVNQGGQACHSGSESDQACSPTPQP